MPIKFKKLIILVVVVMVIITCTILPAAAAISQFNFTPSKFNATLDGYDSWLIYQYKSWYYILYFNESDVSNLSYSSYDNQFFKILNVPSGTPYFRFNSLTDCFTYAAYQSSSCDCSSLIDTKNTCTSGYLLFTKTSFFMTNSSAMTDFLSVVGYPVDSNYYIYFNNTDSKQYIVCSLTVDGADSPVVVLAPSIPSFDASTMKLTCANDMYIFDTESVDNCVEFLQTDNVNCVNKVKKSKTISNVSKFHYSSFNIIDSATNNVYFYASSIDDNDSPAGPGGGGNSGVVSGGVLDPDQESEIKDVYDSVNDFIASIPDWFTSWLPASFVDPIAELCLMLIIVISILFLIKVLPVW